MNDKLQIVGCNALPTLVLMLRSEEPTIHYEAVRHRNELHNPLYIFTSVVQRVVGYKN